jgi:hypothetical protein
MCLKGEDKVLKRKEFASQAKNARFRNLKDCKVSKPKEYAQRRRMHGFAFDGVKNRAMPQRRTTRFLF